jgi:hypothetical protein
METEYTKDFIRKTISKGLVALTFFSLPLACNDGCSSYGRERIAETQLARDSYEIQPPHRIIELR